MESHDAFEEVFLYSTRSLQESTNMTPSAAPTTGETVSQSNDALIIRDTLRVYGSVYLLFFVVFCYVRRKHPKYYNIRSWVPEMQCELAQSMEYPGWLSWAWRVMYVNDTLLLQNCGMDGLCFIRCLRLGAKLSFSGVLNSVWLIPLFFTADNEGAQVTVTDKFAKISVANLPAGSPRIAGVVVAAYITLFYALHLLSKELDWYAEFRHKYLSLPLPRNYAIYVSGIPEELRSDFALGDYFRSWSAEGAVLEAHMAMDTPSLDADVAKREILLEKLEHAMAREKFLGGTVQHRKVKLTNIFQRGAITEKVDTVNSHMEELNKLNHKISFAVGKITNRNDRMRQFMNKQPGSSKKKMLIVPALSPLGEAEPEISFHPEEPLSDESIEPLSGERHGVNNRAIGIEEQFDSQQPNLPVTETKPYLHRKDTPAHPFLQLIGLSSFYDDAPATEPNSESNQLNSSSSIASNGVQPTSESNQPNRSSLLASNDAAECHDIEVGATCDVEPEISPVPPRATGGENKGLPLHRSPSLDAGDDSKSEVVVSFGNASQEERRSSSKSTFDHMKNFSDVVAHKASTSVAGGVKKVTGSVKQVKKVTGKGLQGAVKAADLGLSSAKKVAEMGLNQAPELATKLKETAAFIAPALAGKEDGAPRNAGFVVFRNLFTCQAARQMLQHESAHCMVVEPAPPPDEIFWRNVGLPDNARKTGTLLSTVATTSLCFFWSVPVAFLSSLTEVNSLKEKLPALARLVDEMPWLESFLAMLAPLLLLAMNEGVLPSALKTFSTWEGLVGSPQLEASTFVKLSAFVIVQTFFVSAISGSIMAELANILENPEDLVVLLGNSLATQSSYFIQIVLVFTFLVQGIALLRIQPIGFAILRRFVGPRLTAKERRKAWKFVAPLEDPPEFFHGEVFAQMILFYVVFFVYAPIAPVTCIFLFGAFLICESGYRYHLIHNNKTTPDSGGRIFRGFTQVLLGSIFIGQLTLLGTLGLKQAVYALPALAPLLVVTIIYTILIYPKKLQVADSLPTILSVELDRQREADGADVGFLVGAYLQPSLKQKFLYPDTEFEQ